MIGISQMQWTAFITAYVSISSLQLFSHYLNTILSSSSFSTLFAYFPPALEGMEFLLCPFNFFSPATFLLIYPLFMSPSIFLTVSTGLYLIRY